jgi:hypothetical protein
LLPYICSMKQKILLIDGAGALFSAVLLLLLPCFEQFFGISKNVAYALLPIPLVYSVYSMLAYRLSNKKWKRFLKIIAVANLLYCGLTLLAVMQNFKTLTKLGVLYFAAEILLITALAIVELNIASKKEG